MSLYRLSGWIAILFVSSKSCAQISYADDILVREDTRIQFFGWQIEITDRHIIASSHLNSDLSLSGGLITIFDIDTRQEIGSLVPDSPMAFDRLGTSLDIAGDLVVSGGVNLPLASNAPEGSAFAFSLTSHEQIFRVTRPGVFDGALTGFGASIATDGNLVVVGAPFESSDAYESGNVYVFDSKGNFLHRLASPFPSESTHLGRSVLIEDGIIHAGAPGGAWLGSLVRGAVHSFDAETGAWLRSVSDGSDRSEFGRNLAYSDGSLYVGAPEDAFVGGSVYVFDSETLDYRSQITSPDNFRDGFGFEIAVFGNFLVTGAHDPRGGTGPDRAYAYLFSVPDGALISRLRPTSTYESNLFDQSLTLGGGLLAAGAYSDDLVGLDAGAIYLFDLAACFDAEFAPPFTALDFNDLLAFLTAFSSADPAADLAEPFGVINFNDVLDYLTLFAQGCP